MKKVVVGVTGSIAAYKAADIVSSLYHSNYDVKVVMTKNAIHFITPLTLSILSHHPVILDEVENSLSIYPDHIHLANDVDLILIAPASANIIARIALGLADDILSSMVLATHAQLVIAPAMNDKMWHHPATLANIKQLNDRGVTIITPSEGNLACGYHGIGRLACLTDILQIIEKLLN